MLSYLVIISFKGYGDHRDLHSFPTRRSSDLSALPTARLNVELKAPGTAELLCTAIAKHGLASRLVVAAHSHEVIDRKSTRLNSSHSSISYAVFCLKKKN